MSKLIPEGTQAVLNFSPEKRQSKSTNNYTRTNFIGSLCSCWQNESVLDNIVL